MTQSSKLSGKVAIVTGAGSKPSDTGAFGTGKAIAVLFAREGAQVVVVDRHDDRANETHRVIEEAGGQVATIVADLADESGCANIVQQTMVKFGRLDVLVNNAAVAIQADLLETTTEILQQHIIVNLTVPFMLSKAAIPVMIKNGGGSIVNISSIAAIRGHGAAAYTATKAAMIGLTTSIATSYGKQGVRANCIAVGALDTPMRRAAARGEHIKARNIALANEGDAWDVARAALFLASADSSHITGVLLPVDGGLSSMVP